MTTFEEGDLQIALPENARARKFDGPQHGLSHCMKAIDWIVELEDRLLFIEIKDPERPGAPPEEREKFLKRLQRGVLDEDLKYKYRDTFLYEWASERIGKPIDYLVLIAMSNLDAPLLLARTDALKQKLPLNGPPTGTWRRSIVDGCAVLDIETWNRKLPSFRVERISSSS